MLIFSFRLKCAQIISNIHKKTKIAVKISKDRDYQKRTIYMFSSYAIIAFIFSIIPSNSRLVDAFQSSSVGRHSLRCESSALFQLRKRSSFDEKVIDDSCTEYFSDTRAEDVANDRACNRRKALQLIGVSSILLSSQVANAGKAEIDSKSGELFSPKKDMIGGRGSDLARGIQLESKRSVSVSDNEILQSIYETRFITYLSRFLLSYDPAAAAWWNEQDFKADGKMSSDVKMKLRFAEFAESVEVGLADYFVGPYGSYANPTAAKAGLSAKAPQTSVGSLDSKTEVKTGFFDTVKKKLRKNRLPQALDDKKVRDNARKGILNLFSLLQARYTSSEEKRQLAILFSLISNPKLQPAREIKGILGESDDGSVKDFKVVGLQLENNNYRTNSRHGGGYSKYEKPEVIIDAPPALGSSYKPATFIIKTTPTSRILNIKVLDGGNMYKTPPKVEVIQKGVSIPCEATAILDRDGSVESIIVLDPGYGYGLYDKKKDVIPEVMIAPPKIPRGASSKERKKYKSAIAVADLEYAITEVKLVDGGNGYILGQPPKAYIKPPSEDADWYLSPIDRKTWRAVDSEAVTIEVTEMYSKETEEIRSVETNSESEQKDLIASDPSILDKMANDPLALLPPNTPLFFTAPGDPIPETGDTAARNGNYKVMSLPAPTTSLFLPSPRYRAYDPVFGAIGNKPVTKNAAVLTGSEYTRLALSGSICTVLVRTALNPLELVKTKIQLKNDEELLQLVNKKSQIDQNDSENSQTENKSADSKSKAGTLDVIKAMITLRGPFSVFQSADITFLASIVFGSLGFGATELFRRSFTMVFFGENGGSAKGTGEELVLLAAAAVACIITSLAAAPFEILRVRSMGYVEPKPVSDVLSDFLIEKRKDVVERKKKKNIFGNNVIVSNDKITLKDIKKDDIPPLFSGFLPIASRELPFAVTKFLAFDLVATTLVSLVNAQPQILEPVQVGSGGIGLALSAIAGAFAGIAGAVVSHPADLILTLTSSQKKNAENSTSNDDDEIPKNGVDWKPIVRDLLDQDGGILNLFAGLPARATFFFLVIGLQFFLYDYAKTVFQVGSEDLTLVLDVFYAIRQGLQ